MQRKDVERLARYLDADTANALRALLDRAEKAEVELAEMTRRRDSWREKAKDVDVLRAAVRAGVKEAGPANLSRVFLRGALAENERRLSEMGAERDAAFAAGQEEMRERAALEAERGLASAPKRDGEMMQAIAEGIRDIPIKDSP